MGRFVCTEETMIKATDFSMHLIGGIGPSELGVYFFFLTTHMGKIIKKKKIRSETFSTEHEKHTWGFEHQ